MEYWISWLKMLGMNFEICFYRFCLTILNIGFVANYVEKRYCFWFALPKYSLIITNEKEYPYVPEVWYWKIGHVHWCHTLGSKLKEIPKKTVLSNA
jgi:hypothetical protein